MPTPESPSALQCFTPAEQESAHVRLAAQVATMMGRKFEEGDWSHVYCGAKSIANAGWSNLSIDVTHGNLGVEHKMICKRDDRPLTDYCGTEIMHPAGTRAIRIPRGIEDATTAARDVLQQYAEIVRIRTESIRIVYEFNQGVLPRSEAIVRIAKCFGLKNPAAAAKYVPAKPTPVHTTLQPGVDLRTGWMLWHDSLREFLYFEEQTVPPNPAEYVAEWRESGGGRRRESRNLWVFHEATQLKRFSITTDAGAKIQPYFRVPLKKDPGLYHFVVQGEQTGDLVRIWVTEMTARVLVCLVGDISRDKLSAVIEKAASQALSPTKVMPYEAKAVPVLITKSAYEKLRVKFSGVSDEHMIQRLVQALDGGRSPSQLPPTR